jgi:molybdenum cofactor biosynthesis protein B
MTAHDEHKGLRDHRAHAPASVTCAVLTVSDTRTLETDAGGALAISLLEGAGHAVALRRLVRDEPAEIGAGLEEALAHPNVQGVVLTGGTGVAPRDRTPEAVEPYLDRVLPGFGELFRQLSYAEIGAAAMLSRALAGIAQGRIVFVLPGSRGALRLAFEKLILPEIGHLAGEARKDR